MKYTLGAVMMFRDEARYLKEWIEFHRLIGVEHFYLFDHLSKDHPEIVLADYIAKGIVELERRNDEVGGNFMTLAVEMNNKAINLARGTCQWVVILDSDEFIVPKTVMWLPTLLKDYEQYGGLTMNWQMYGTGGVAEVPHDKTMVESLTMKGLEKMPAWARVIKSIVQPERVNSVGLHYGIYKNGYYAVNTSHKRIEKAWDEDITVDKIQLNHYFSRDLKFRNEVKIQRRIGLGVPADELIKWDEEMSVVKDECILRFVEGLRARLAGGVDVPVVRLVELPMARPVELPVARPVELPVARPVELPVELPLVFNWKAYVTRYPDLKKIKTKELALKHWMKFGKREGRVCS
jgi:hypothetical protein